VTTLDFRLLETASCCPQLSKPCEISAFVTGVRPLRPPDAIRRGLVALVGICYARGDQGARVLGSRSQRQIPSARRSRAAGLASPEGNTDFTSDTPGVQGRIDHESDDDCDEQNAQPNAVFHAKKSPMWRNFEYRCSTSWSGSRLERPSSAWRRLSLRRRAAASASS
jgi:hypothetical protein